MLVDSHCHLDFPDFKEELDAVVARARAAGIGRLVTISTRVRKLDGLLALAERFPDVYCSVGTHPHNAHEELDIKAADLVGFARHPKVVAIGEAGLDYHYDNSPVDQQEQGLRQHIMAAREAGLPLIGQTVLLSGINDDVDTLDRLLRDLVGCRVKPYYLHHPDLVRGTGHFRVSIERGQELMRALRGRLSGLAQPIYVLDVPGGHGKVPIGPAYLRDDPDALSVEDAFGGRHPYPG